MGWVQVGSGSCNATWPAHTCMELTVRAQPVNGGWPITQAVVSAGDRELAACTFSPAISSASRHMLAGKGQLQQDFLARQAFFIEAQRWVVGASRVVKPSDHGRSLASAGCNRLAATCSVTAWLHIILWWSLFPLPGLTAWLPWPGITRCLSTIACMALISSVG